MACYIVRESPERGLWNFTWNVCQHCSHEIGEARCINKEPTDPCPSSYGSETCAST